MKISIIIPTHNREKLLKTVIEGILELKDETEFEFVIVDNNSTDGTKQLVESYSQYARYVFEHRTSFTRARKTGAENATGDIFLYLDDDVIVHPGSLKNIVDVFCRYEDCGVIAGKILPRYTEEPPEWTLKCQESFNGWSLFDETQYSYIIKPFQEVPSAAGPMMAISRVAYENAGGFPPDTIGVETNQGNQTFNKLYIGPGDYGLCYKIKQQGKKIYYSDQIAVDHIIPPVRFTVKFWRSRMIGEAYHEAITQREFFKLRPLEADYRRKRSQTLLKRFEKKLLKKLSKQDQVYKDGMHPEELWVHFHKAYLDMDTVLNRYPDLSAFLWEIGDNGVDDSNYSYVMDRFPAAFKKLVGNDIVYNPSVLKTDNYLDIFPDFKYHQRDLSTSPFISVELYNIAMKVKAVQNKMMSFFK